MWNRDELRAALMPTLEKLYKQEPDSIPFRHPVDPVSLQIPVSIYLGHRFIIHFYCVNASFLSDNTASLAKR